MTWSVTGRRTKNVAGMAWFVVIERDKVHDAFDFCLHNVVGTAIIDRSIGNGFQSCGIDSTGKSFGKSCALTVMIGEAAGQ
jgi:hypothetical protein